MLPKQAISTTFFLFAFNFVSPWVGSSTACYQPYADNMEKTHPGLLKKTTTKPILLYKGLWSKQSLMPPSPAGLVAHRAIMFFHFLTAKGDNESKWTWASLFGAVLSPGFHSCLCLFANSVSGRESDKST